MNPTDLVDRASLRSDIPAFGPGDTLKVHVRVVEGTRERVQVFQGAVIRRQGSGVRETFTVRKVSFGVGVERTFPVHSPIVAQIEVVTRGDVRRAKLYYLRDRIGKAAKIKESRKSLPERRKKGEPRNRAAAVPAAEEVVESVDTLTVDDVVTPEAVATDAVGTPEPTATDVAGDVSESVHESGNEEAEPTEA